MGRGGEEPVCDPGSELRLGGRENRKAKIINGVEKGNKTKRNKTRQQEKIQHIVNGRLLFTCRTGNEKRRVILKALIENLKIKTPVRNSLIGMEKIKRYSSCRYNERQLIDVTVVRRVRPRAERRYHAYHYPLTNKKIAIQLYY